MPPPRRQARSGDDKVPLIAILSQNPKHRKYRPVVAAPLAVGCDQTFANQFFPSLQQGMVSITTGLVNTFFTIWLANINASGATGATGTTGSSATPTP